MNKLQHEAIRYMFLLFFIAFLSVPIIGSFWNSQYISFESLAYLKSHYGKPVVLTLVLGIVVSLLTLFWASCALFSIKQLSGKTKRTLLIFALLPLLFPPYIGAITYIDIFKSPTFLTLVGRSSFIEFIQASFVFSLFLYPYVFLLFYSRLRMISPAQESIIALYKLSWWKKLVLFYIPHLKYAGFSGILLVFLYTISDFGAASILRLHTLTIQIYQEIIGRFNHSEAAFVSFLYIIFTATAIFMGQKLLGEPTSAYKTEKKYSDIQSRSFFTACIALLFLSLLIFLSVGLPMGKIGIWFYQYLVDASYLKSVWITAKQDIFFVGLTSFMVTLGVTLGMLFSTFFFSALIHKKTESLSATPYYLASMLHGLPGIVIVFGLLVIKQTLPSTDIMAWIIFLSGYFYRYIGIAFVVIEPAIAAIPKNYTAIAAIFTRGKFSHIRYVSLPLTKNALLHAGNYIFFNGLRELVIPLLLLPLGVEVLSMRIWQVASEGLYSYASPAIFLLLFLSLPSLVLFVKNKI